MSDQTPPIPFWWRSCVFWIWYPLLMGALVAMIAVQIWWTIR